MKNLKVKRRLGKDPHTLPETIARGGSVACDGCPDVLELEDGSFAIIGVRVTAELRDGLPPSMGCGSDEEIVLIPREILINAKQDIPDVV